MLTVAGRTYGALRFITSTISSLLLVTLAFSGGLIQGQAQILYGTDSGTGNLYRISTVDASLSLVGNTGTGFLGGLEFAPDGRLFGFTLGTTPNLYQINPLTAAASLIGPLNIGFVFEGGLAFAPNGTAYGVNQGSDTAANLFTLNLTTGQATIIGTLSGGSHDINGLGWRSDGNLVGLDRVSNSLLIINPATAVVSPLAPLAPTVGGVGGMTDINDQGYFCTSGPGGSIPGSDQLFSFNAMTGAYSLIGSFPSTITGNGISGLALIPEPSSAMLAALALTLWGTLSRRRGTIQ